MGAFSHKFSIVPSGKITDRIKKVSGVQKWQTSSITMPSMVEIVGRAPAVDEKLWCFLFCLSVCFFCLSRFGITKFVITETLWSSVITARCAVYAGTRCLSVRPSVTFVDHVKTNKDIFEFFSPSGSHTILVFQYQTGCRYSDGNPPP